MQFRSYAKGIVDVGISITRQRTVCKGREPILKKSALFIRFLPHSIKGGPRCIINGSIHSKVVHITLQIVVCYHKRGSRTAILFVRFKRIYMESMAEDELYKYLPATSQPL